MEKCKDCQADIVWAKTEAGKNIPLDGRILTIITDEGKAVRGREAHFATCTRMRSMRGRKS